MDLYVTFITYKILWQQITQKGADLQVWTSKNSAKSPRAEARRLMNRDLLMNLLLRKLARPDAKAAEAGHATVARLAIR